MGYELVFHYKEADDKPGSYKEEIKKRNCKLGKATDDVDIEIVAGKILSQLARRNIFLVDVEIYEYAKKKISYRETKDGIILKNKKFSFDSSHIVVSDDLSEKENVNQEEFKPIPSPSKELADKSCPLINKKRIIRHEIYDPDPIGEVKVRNNGLKFTMGKKYPIYSEESLGATIIYNTIDDSGKDVKVSAEYFIVVGAGLSEDSLPNYVGAENQKEEINLWKNYEQTEMPDIRRK